MKKLKIAQVAPLWISVPPKKYGGIELVVSNLTEELVKRGHQVTLFASGDSKTSAKLVSVYPRGVLRDGISWRDKCYDMLNLSTVFEHAQEFDIIHTHIDLWNLYFARLVSTPTVHTIHNRLYSSKKKNSRLFVMEHYKKNNFIAISNSQRKLSRVKLNFIKTVHNGIRVEDFKFNANPDDHFIWIARIDKYKGIENVIRVAKKAKIKLTLAGRLDKVQENYFKNNVKPHLNKNIKFIGEIGKKEKSSFFGRAKALLYPIEWEEPFGLLMSEAMACGTPVIAFKKGSVPEIVKNNKTGFVVNTISEMVKAIKKIDQIDRRECRKHVEENFTVQKMADGYEDAYKKILKIK